LALGRLLREALGDEERCRALIADALESAERSDPPADPTTLLQFVRDHLVPRLAEDIGAPLAAAVLDDLSAQIEATRYGEASEIRAREPAMEESPASRERPAGARCPTETQAPGEAILARITTSKSDPLIAAHVRTASDDLFEESTGGSVDARMATATPLVRLAHFDAVTRASLARAFLNARFDVEAFESIDDLLKSVRERGEPTIAIVGDKGEAWGTTLKAVVSVAPELRVVAWTAVDRASAEESMAFAGVSRFGILSSDATASDVIEAVRELIDE
jgi:hypothetical protein